MHSYEIVGSRTTKIRVTVTEYDLWEIYVVQILNYIIN
jgi:hypothetical protein